MPSDVALPSSSEPEVARGRAAARAAALWAAAALAGGAALAYEICWSRALVIPLGNSSDATALVLAAFMLGMAVGARFGGALAERWARPLRGYALLEGALGVYALLAPWLLRLLDDIPGELVGSGALGVLVRRVAALLLVLIPCLPMGASLPLLARALTGQRAPVGLHIGLLYGANTLGAALGAILTGFIGIARVGVTTWSVAAALGSFAAANLALAVSMGAGAAAPPARDTLQRPPEAQRRWALAAAAVSGFAMLACELLWSRVLTFVFGHDVYAFASLLAIVLIGLAVGGLGHRLLAARDQVRLLALLLGLFSWVLLFSFGAAAALVIARGRDVLALEAAGWLTGSVWLELTRELAYTPVLVLAPSIVAGATFPAACAAYAGDAADTGRNVGDVLLANGVGSALGAVAGAFGLVSLAGLQGAFLLIAALCAATSSAVSLLARPGRRVRWARALVVPLGGCSLLALGLSPDLPRRMLLRAVGERHQTLLFYEEGRTATISVIQSQINGEKQLVINAVNEVTTRLVHDQSFKLLGHLGPLLHPDPRRAVMICLGAGLSAGAALTHPLERLDVVDLSPTVARGARYFSVENNGVLDHPAFRLHTEDGRQFLLNASERYDLAIIDSTHPKAVDSWILYTREFYQLVRSRLAPGGIAVQWLPLHGLSEREFKIIVNTFLAVFPEMSLWANVGFETYGQVGYAKLVGAAGAAPELSSSALSARLARAPVTSDLTPFGMQSPEAVLDSFIAAAGELRAWTEGLPEQSDDHPLVSYTTAYSSGRRMEPALLLAVRGAAPVHVVDRDHLPAEQRGRLERAWEAQGVAIAGDLARAQELQPEGSKLQLFAAQARTTRGYYRALAERYSDEAERQFEAGSQLATLGAPEDARVVLSRAVARWPGDVRLALTLALVERGFGDTDAALAHLTGLSERAPRSALVEYNLGATLLSRAEVEAAVAHLTRALALDPEMPSVYVALAQAHLDRGEDDLAGARLTDVLQHNPWVAEAEDMAGMAASRRGDHELAVTHHRRALRLQPYRAASHYNLGVALAGAGAQASAAAAYEAALRYHPGHARAANNLGLLHAAAGRRERAMELYLRALEAEPSYAEAAYNLGLSLRAEGRAGEAAEAFCLSLKLRASLEPARMKLAELGRGEHQCPGSAGAAAGRGDAGR